MFNSQKDEKARSAESFHEQSATDEEIFDSAKVKPESVFDFNGKFKALCNGVYQIAEALAGFKFYKYEAEFANRVIESVLLGDGSTITGHFARQSGKSFTMAQLAPALTIMLPLYSEYAILGGVLDSPLSKWKAGFWCGVYGPDYDRAAVIGNKINASIASRQGRTILSSRPIEMKFPERLTRYLGHLPRNSFIYVKSANKRISIEGNTFHMVITDETQEIDDYVLKKSISPMLAATLGTCVHLGSSYPKKVYFYDIIKTNKKEDLEKSRKKKCHFEYFYKTVQKYNPNYKKYIELEKKKMGEYSDEFRMCVAPETKILTADLHHISASEVVVGMKLVGFDENSPGKTLHRKFKESIVEKVWNVTLPGYKLDLEDGTTIICSANHPWLVTTAGRRTEWKTTENLGVKRYKNQNSEDRIFKVSSVWDYTPTHQIGYLAGAYDGEGSISFASPGRFELSFSQKEGKMLERVRQYLSELNFNWSERTQPNNCKNIIIRGGRVNVLRFLGQVRPQRLVDKFKVEYMGSIGRHDHRGNGKGFEHPRILKKTFIGDQNLIAFQTSTRTFVAEGLASHNSYEGYWPIEKGMFITEDILINMCGADYSPTPTDRFNDHVIAIDLAKVLDSTVMTVVQPMWDEPIVLDKESRLVRYPKVIKNWFEISGTDYDKQFIWLEDMLSNFKWSKLIIDATGVGAHMYDRFKNLFADDISKQVIPFVFSSASKSDMYLMLYRELLAGRVKYPNSDFAKYQNKQQKFVQQMTNLSKDITQNGYLKIEHLEEQGHDDYGDSLAMAVWAIEGEPYSFNSEQIDMPNIFKPRIPNVITRRGVSSGLRKVIDTPRNFWETS